MSNEKGPLTVSLRTAHFRALEMSLLLKQAQYIIILTNLRHKFSSLPEAILVFAIVLYVTKINLRKNNFAFELKRFRLFQRNREQNQHKYYRFTFIVRVLSIFLQLTNIQFASHQTIDF